MPRRSLLTPAERTGLKAGDTLLEKGVDYDVAYEGNTAPGRATMTITGKGTYAGKVAYASFEISTRYFLKPTVASEGDGLSWATAMSVANFFATHGNIDSQCEVWIASGTVPAAALLATNTAPLVIRGGFAGTEASPDERAEGTLTVLDGTQTVDCLLKITNTADLEIERIKFCNARANGFIKEGAGGLTVRDCVIEANGKSVNTSWGRGMNVQSGGAGTLVVTDCVFAGNRCTSGDTQYGGFGIYVKSFGSAIIDRSLFRDERIRHQARGDAVGWRLGLLRHVFEGFGGPRDRHPGHREEQPLCRKLLPAPQEPQRCGRQRRRAYAHRRVRRLPRGKLRLRRQHRPPQPRLDG